MTEHHVYDSGIPAMFKRISQLEDAVRNALDLIEIRWNDLDGYEQLRVVDIRDALSNVDD